MSPPSAPPPAGHGPPPTAALAATALFPREFLLRRPRRTAALSMRNTSVMKRGGVFSAEFLKVFLPSLLLSHLLAIGLG